MELLDRVLQESTSRAGLSQVYEAGKLIPRWREIVGDQIARNTHPTLIRGGKLLVSTTSSTWSHQLSMLKPQLLIKINEAGFKINDICLTSASIQVSPDSEKDNEEGGGGAAAPPDFSTVPTDITGPLRQALGSYLGATGADGRHKKLKSPAKYGKIDK